jgi:hypothetical protein
MKNSVSLVMIATVAGAIIYGNGMEIRLPGMNQGYAPEQPIAFSHRLHAGEMTISCQYCHAGVEKSRHAGIPAASTCMNCHSFVTKPGGRLAEGGNAHGGGQRREGSASGELKKLYTAVGFDPVKGQYERGRYEDGQRGKGIEWIRVHSLPDFVHFDHRSHVNAGVDCQRCHGPVERMERIVQWSSLTMGWCVNCHRDVNQGRIDGLQGKSASIDCSTCHY